jgi:hypothetical protein
MMNGIREKWLSQIRGSESACEKNINMSGICETWPTACPNEDAIKIAGAFTMMNQKA